MAEKKDVKVAVRLPAKEVEKLHELAEKYDTTISHVVRYAVKQHITRAEKQPTRSELFGA